MTRIIVYYFVFVNILNYMFGLFLLTNINNMCHNY